NVDRSIAKLNVVAEPGPYPEQAGSGMVMRADDPVEGENFGSQADKRIYFKVDVDTLGQNPLREGDQYWIKLDTPAKQDACLHVGTSARTSRMRRYGERLVLATWLLAIPAGLALVALVLIASFDPKKHPRAGRFFDFLILRPLPYSTALL